MYDFRGFDELKVGQRLKVKGTPSADGSTFTALEIAAKEHKDIAEIEGLVQAVDVSSGVLRLVNKDFSIPGNAVIKDTMKNEIGLDGLKEGDVVKVKGTYEPGTPFSASKVKMKESMGFNIEEMQGCIDSLDADGHRFEMIGVTVVVTEKTAIEL